jgi:hypothetical protein
MDHTARKDALNALFKILLLESVLLTGVIVAYFATGKLSYLIGGLIGSQVIVAPMLISWVKEKAPAFKAPPGNP